MSAANKRILVGMSGGISAFKAVHVVRELLRRGAEVRVAMTPSATRFIGPMTLAGLTGHSVATDLWDPSYPGEVHVELAAWADAILIAPATANLLARAAHGMADDVVLASVCCSDVPVCYAPAMHWRMWQHPATQHNVRLLAERGATLIGPVEGALASGERGAGRMQEPDAIVEALEARLRGRTDLAGARVVVTAGPTVEDLDPVRFVSNRSSGRMGYAIAERAKARGAQVTLVSGPVSLSPPAGVDVRAVRSARQLQRAVQDALAQADALIMAAAPADYRPKQLAEHKIKKSDDHLQITLERNPDILAELGAARQGRRPVLVGFALESEDLLERARDKLRRKKVDVIVANDASVGFGGDRTEVILVSERNETRLEPATKLDVADRILDRVRALLAM